MTLKVGTRASHLSRRQTESVLHALRQVDPALRFDVVEVRTAGDRTTRSIPELGGVGWFTRELEAALLAGRVDLVVHSLKDLPTDPTPGLVVAAVPEREDPRDALVGPWPSLLDLPLGARVGTSSPRRAAQLRAVRRDLDIVPLRGNVDTRLRKVAAGEVDAAVLALSGLLRGGWQDRVVLALDPEQVLPAPGQGALAVQVRDGDRGVRDLAAALDHPASRAAVEAERAFLRALGGGCTLPAAALATCTDGTVRLRVRLLSEDGSRRVDAAQEGPQDLAEEVGRRAAEAVRGFLALVGGSRLSWPSP